MLFVKNAVTDEETEILSEVTTDVVGECEAKLDRLLNADEE